MQEYYYKNFTKNTRNVTVHTGLCIDCKVRKKMIQECKNSIAEGNGIFACQTLLYTLFINTVIWRFFCNMNIMRMAFF